MTTYGYQLNIIINYSRYTTEFQVPLRKMTHRWQPASPILGWSIPLLDYHGRRNQSLQSRALRPRKIHLQAKMFNVPSAAPIPSLKTHRFVNESQDERRYRNQARVLVGEEWAYDRCSTTLKNAECSALSRRAATETSEALAFVRRPFWLGLISIGYPSATKARRPRARTSAGARLGRSSRPGRISLPPGKRPAPRNQNRWVWL